MSTGIKATIGIGTFKSTGTGTPNTGTSTGSTSTSSPSSNMVLPRL
jgi:hypothetical protein